MSTEEVALVVGAEYEVIAAGARLSGMLPMGGYHQGWGQELPVGTRVRYEGVHWGWGSDPIKEHNWSTPESKAVHAQYVNLRPFRAFMDTRPALGLVKAVEA